MVVKSGKSLKFYSKGILQVTKKKKVKMNVPRKNSHTKPKQFEIMVDFMEQHPELAKGHINSPEAKSKSKHLWERLSEDLNAACVPSRDVNGWKKVWADYKNHVKVKCRRNKNAICGTGGGPNNSCSLTVQEQKVADLLSINVAVNGMSGTSDFGARIISSESHTSAIVTGVENVEQSNIIIPEQSYEELNTYTPHRSRRKQDGTKNDDLLHKQVENQIAFQENSLKILTAIDQNQKNFNTILKEINNNIADVKKYQKRNCDLKERKLKLAKEKFEFKKKMELEKSKRKMAHLELKKQIFELESAKHAIIN